jgi:hypothetical protein
MHVIALSNNAPDGYSSIDLLIDGKLYEIKSPYAAGGGV